MNYKKSNENNSNTINTISIYAISNKYGYKYNVNHPLINDLYTRYKKGKGIAYTHPLSDIERADFEKYVDSLFENKDIDGNINISNIIA